MCESVRNYVAFRQPSVFGNKMKYIYFRQNERLASLCHVFTATYRSLNAIVAKSKNCSFGVNTTIELKNIATTLDNGARVGVVVKALRYKPAGRGFDS